MTRFVRSAQRRILLSGCSAAVLTLAGGTAPALAHDGHSPVVLEPGSLVVSTSTYDATQGAIAALTVGTTLPGTATATTAAVAGNDYVNTWNNASVDGSYGVTSAIRLLDVDPFGGRVLHTVDVPTDQVVTSFPSKSELGLHLAGGFLPRLVFVGYGGAGVGALDVSNSDAVKGQDPTNPVTFAFGTSYAFPRTIVTMDMLGHFSYTPTVAYGGNNGRSALLARNGLYYSVGNANNGKAAAFGAGNGTNPDVTETTGLEVVKPIDAPSVDVSIPAGNSAEVDPLLQYSFGGKLDKPGKDNNYRGITEYKGALYFTKGSGSNGIDTLYTVPSLPSLSNAATTSIGIVPGFPTDSAKATGGDYTPFGVFFTNPSTMYVADEGTGDAADAASHAGLEKWSLVNGSWQLDYVLQNGLIGATDNLTGSDGAYPTVTTIGLRNLTGVVGFDGRVTLWAATSTSSASGDNGADPNKVVAITDVVAARTMTPQIAAERFRTVVGPTYGTVYRGVAFVSPFGF